MQTPPFFSRGLLLACVALWAAPAVAQVRTRFPLPGETTTVFQNPTGPPAFRAPASGGSSLTPVTPPGSTAPGVAAPGAALGAPSFDPYSAPGAANVAPSLGPPGTTPYGGTTFGPPTSGSPYGTAPGSVPYSTTPGSGFGAPPSQPPWGNPGAAGASPYYNPYPQQPPAVYPNGIGGADWWSPQPGPYLRLFSDLRMRYTWLPGETGNELDINDIDFAATVNFPNFFYCGDPLRISPSFSFHYWDGPDTIAPVTADLPPGAFSAFIDARWDPKFSPFIGAELGLSVGTYTDFQYVTTDSIRVQGVGLLVLNLSPEISLKGGIEYLDRVNIKMLPAFGILWRPNPRTRWDVYFPRPKLSQYLTTVGNTDIWWYLGGEYGGGSWTIQRVGKNDQADINDIRVFAGLDWTHQAGVKGFVEFGFVFDREIRYRYFPADDLNLSSTMMLRAGISL